MRPARQIVLLVLTHAQQNTFFGFFARSEQHFENWPCALINTRVNWYARYLIRAVIDTSTVYAIRIITTVCLVDISDDDVILVNLQKIRDIIQSISAVFHDCGH